MKPIPHSNTLSSRLLLLAAVANFGVALLHFVLAFAGETANRYFGAPPGVLRLLRQERPLVVLLIMGMAALFCLFGLYDLAGAGRFRRLPFLKTVLVTVGAVYTLRGLELPRDVAAALKLPAFGHQYIVFSAVALAIGLATLGGTFGQWRSLDGATKRKFS